MSGVNTACSSQAGLSSVRWTIWGCASDAPCPATAQVVQLEVEPARPGLAHRGVEEAAPVGRPHLGLVAAVDRRADDGHARRAAGSRPTCRSGDEHRPLGAAGAQRRRSRRGSTRSDGRRATRPGGSCRRRRPAGSTGWPGCVRRVTSRAVGAHDVQVGADAAEARRAERDRGAPPRAEQDPVALGPLLREPVRPGLPARQAVPRRSRRASRRTPGRCRRCPARSTGRGRRGSTTGPARSAVGLGVHDERRVEVRVRPRRAAGRRRRRQAGEVEPSATGTPSTDEPRRPGVVPHGAPPGRR